MTRRNIDIKDDSLWQWIKLEAVRQGKPSRAIVEEALREYKERQEGEGGYNY